MKMYRQGDVLIVEEARRPPEMQQSATDVLVYGEATGHAHRVEGAPVLEVGDTKYVDAPNPFRVVHEEHETIEIPEGFYRIIRQREYDEGEIRYVAD